MSDVLSGAWGRRSTTAITCLTMAAALMAASPTGAQERSVGEWRADLRYFADELAVRHADAFHTVPRDSFYRAVAHLDAALPRLTPERRLLELARIGALVGDGHTGVFLFSNRLFPNAAVRSLRRLPLQLSTTGDSVFVLAASSEHRPLLGAVVVNVEGRPVRQVLDSIRPLVSADNPFGVERNALAYLAIPEVLHGLGVAPTADSIRLTVRDRHGEARRVIVRSVAWEATRDLPAHTPTAISRLVFEKRAARYWSTALPDGRGVYAQVNSWDIGPGRPDAAFAAFTDSLRALVASPTQPALILDFRWNTGGRIDAARHLLRMILSVPHLAEEGKLFAVIGRQTFSAGVLFLLDLERYTSAILVGEATSGRVNSYGDLKRFTLPATGVEVRYSAVRMVRGDPWDLRPAVYPDIPAALTLRAYRDGEDPALTAVFAYQPRTPAAERVLAAYRAGGIERAVSAYRALRRDSVQRYDFSELELDQVADSLLAAGQASDAVRILKLNVAEYPYVPWLVFNLAEGYRALGDTTAALTRYRQAFAADKRLGVARDRILELERGRSAR